MQKIEKADARALLQSTQQLRIHWSGVIIRLIGYVVALNVAIWSYFLKSYIQLDKPVYIVIASVISSISLVLWRLYTHYLDHRIAALYLDFLLYEKVLSVPYGHGTRSYLIDNVPNTKSIFLDNNLKFGEKLETISMLVKKKRIGNRGHIAFDIAALVLILVMFVVSFVVDLQLFRIELTRLNICCFLGITIGAICIWKLYFQKNPSKEKIQKVIREIGGDDQSSVRNEKGKSK